MANTLTPIFFRQFQVFAPIQKTTVISEPVQVILGFSGTVDPDSGMILNLVDIDGWITKFKDLTKKKTYRSRWDFVRFVSVKFNKLIPVRSLSTIRFQFNDLHVSLEDEKLLVSWLRFCELRRGAVRWMCDAHLHAQVKSKAWPPMSAATEATIRKRMARVHLETMSWQQPGFEFFSFEYFDPNLNLRVKDKLV
ncbi:MAG: hypothetical protein JNL11_06280 [Bdellovibrionaceae bacterium]|nr:hypothetical protein [Pseudobdellovibrionaceae bacterium]